MKCCLVFCVFLLIGLVSAADKPNPPTTTVAPTTKTPPTTPPTPPPTTTLAPVPPTPVPVPTDPKVEFQLKNGDKYEVIGEFQAKLQVSGPIVPEVKSYELALNNLTTLNKEESKFTDSKISLRFDANGSSNVSLSFVLNKANETYSLSEIDVIWKNDTKGANKTEYHGSWNGTLFNVTTDHSFLCLADQSFDFIVKPNDTSKITVQFSNFKIDAFRNSNSTELRSPSECELDMKNGDPVPLAVGAALIALVVIVLIAFLIGRKRSRRMAYESV